ncbi:MAG: hypothetical protein AB7F88_17395 [Pyrinomonadaceae bacterium]
MRSILGGLSAILLFAGITTTPAQTAFGGRLTGTWDTVVTIRVCATGAPITSFQSVGSFNRGGTFSGITSGQPPTVRTSERGVWTHVARNSYRFRFKAYLYNPDAVAIGYQIVTQDLELDRRALNWSSEGTSETFTMDGILTGSGCSTATGSRMVID